MTTAHIVHNVSMTHSILGFQTLFASSVTFLYQTALLVHLPQNVKVAIVVNTTLIQVTNVVNAQ